MKIECAKAYFFLVAACFAATAWFFCWTTLLVLVCFCVACLLTAFGDLSPMMFAFRLTVYSPAALRVSPKGTPLCLLMEGEANLQISGAETLAHPRRSGGRRRLHRASYPLASRAVSLMSEPCHVRERPARRRRTPNPTGTRRPTCRPGRRSVRRRISKRPSRPRPIASIPLSRQRWSGMGRIPPVKRLKRSSEN